MLKFTSKIKKVINLSVITGIVLTSTGCSSFYNVSPKDKAKLDKPMLNKNYFNIPNQPAIQEISVDKIIYRKDSLNHKLNIKTFVDIKNTKIITFEDLLKKMPIPITVEDKLKTQLINKFHIQGNLRDVLDELASITNSFWTNDNGVIKFIHEKTIVYKFPIFSNNKLNPIYNIGDTEESFKLTEMKDNIFTEIKNSLSMVLDTENIVGDISTKNTYTQNNSNAINQENLKKSSNSVNNEMKKNNTLNNKNFDISSKSKSNASQLKNSKELNNENGLKTPKNTKSKSKSKQNSIGDLINTDITKINNENKNAKINNFSKSNNNQNTAEKINTKLNENQNTAEKKNTNQNLNKKEFQLTKTKEVNLKTIYKEKKTKVVVSKESGMIIVSVTRNEEPKVDNIINDLTKNIINNMVMIDIYVLEVSKSKLKNFNMELSSIIQQGLKNTSLNLTSTSITGVLDTLTSKQNLATGIPQAVVNGSNISAILGYLTGNNLSKVLSQPKILTMPNIPARIKSSTAVPYVEPQSLNAGGESSITYQIKYINDGIDLGLISNVVDNSIYLSMGIKINQYIEDKKIEVGTLGTIDVPVQAPRILNSTFRMKAGNLAVLGGMNRISHKTEDSANMFVPTNKKNNFEENSIVVLALPRLIKFVKKEKPKPKYKISSIKKINVIQKENKDFKIKYNFPTIEELK